MGTPNLHGRPPQPQGCPEGTERRGDSPRPFGQWHFPGSVPGSGRVCRRTRRAPARGGTGTRLLHNRGQQLLLFLGSCNIWHCHSHLKCCQGIGWALQHPALLPSCSVPQPCLSFPVSPCDPLALWWQRCQPSPAEPKRTLRVPLNPPSGQGSHLAAEDTALRGCSCCVSAGAAVPK